MKTLICLGDSNTWGYDPRGYVAQQYDRDSRWPAILEDRLSIPVINLGRNGALLPKVNADYILLDRAMEQAEDPVLTVLLGTNDLLMGLPPQDAEDDMDAMLWCLRRTYPKLPVLLLGLPPIRISRFAQAARETSALYQSLADFHGLPFLDLSRLPVAFDGVHLTEEGHRLLADMLLPELEKRM